jgi:hypothetical protein
LQSIFRSDHERRRRRTANALQRGEHLGNEIVPLLQRNTQRLLAVLERLQAFLRLCDSLLHHRHPRGGIDDLLVEFAAVVSNLLDLALEPCLFFERLALLGP